MPGGLVGPTGPLTHERCMQPVQIVIQIVPGPTGQPTVRIQAPAGWSQVQTAAVLLDVVKGTLGAVGAELDRLNSLNVAVATPEETKLLLTG